MFTTAIAMFLIHWLNWVGKASSYSVEMANCIYNASEIGEVNRGLEAEEIDKGAEGEGVASERKRA